jgi:hypothetical protein
MTYQPGTIRTVDERNSEGLIACFVCRFWDGNHPDPTAPGLVEKEGRCHRYAPAVGGWPATRGEEWCAEFRPLTPPDPPPIAKDPGRTMRHAVNAVEGEVPGE